MKKLILISAVFVVFLVSQFASISWASPCCDGDYNCDSKVNFQDYVAFVGDFVSGLLKIEPSEICGNANIPVTGQTTSYFTRDDGELQKGVPWPNPRFTDNGDGTVTDNLTGLIWLKNADCFGGRKWEEALTDCNGLNSGECGLTDSSVAGDWRLPNRRELFSLIDDAYWRPALPNTAGTGQWTAGDPFNNVSNVYWSSNIDARTPDFAWYVTMNQGGVSYDSTENPDGYYVWPVRGGQ
jgi:hypothetical protein